MNENPEQNVFYRELDTDEEEPGLEVVEAVATIEEKDPTNMTTLWECIDGMLDHLFSDPPADEADMEISFSYESYRITVTQNGRGKFVDTR